RPNRATTRRAPHEHSRATPLPRRLGDTVASEPSPCFLFYVKDWRSSRKVNGMNYAAQGMYFAMLLEQWESGSVPSSPAEVASLLGGTKTEWTRAWPKLSACFVARKRDGRLVNAKLERVRRDRLKFSKRQAESGLRGAQERWKKHGKPIGSPSNRHQSPMAKNGSSASASASASASHGTPPSNGAPALRERFDAFWAAYPKKTGKGAAWRAWEKLRPNPDLATHMHAARAWQRHKDNWLREGGRYIPNPSTWLNQKRWEDEPTDTPRMSARTMSLGRAAEEFLNG